MRECKSISTTKYLFRGNEIKTYCEGTRNYCQGTKYLFHGFGIGLLGVTPQQQSGSYQGGEMRMMKSVFWWRKPEYPEETTDLRHISREHFISRERNKTTISLERNSISRECNIIVRECNSISRERSSISRERNNKIYVFHTTLQGLRTHASRNNRLTYPVNDASLGNNVLAIGQ